MGLKHLQGAVWVVWLASAVGSVTLLHAEAPPDSDGDGIADTADECPSEPGAAVRNGCPCFMDEGALDSDCDGIPDSQDGYNDYGGGDSGDGTGGSGEPGGGSQGGGSHGGGSGGAGSGGGAIAIDSDNDGVTDSHDHCPGVRGLVSNNGCPDRTANCTSEIIAAGVGLIVAHAIASGAVGIIGGPIGVAGAIAWFIAHASAILAGTFSVMCAIAYFTD